MEHFTGGAIQMSCYLFLTVPSQIQLEGLESAVSSEVWVGSPAEIEFGAF